MKEISSGFWKYDYEYTDNWGLKVPSLAFREKLQEQNPAVEKFWASAEFESTEKLVTLSNDTIQ